MSADVIPIAPDTSLLVVIEPTEKVSEMPMPRDWPSFALTAILVILMLVVLYFTGEVVLPILFAFLLNLLLQPGDERADQAPRSQDP
jgi:hypothetical protein